MAMGLSIFSDNDEAMNKSSANSFVGLGKKGEVEAKKNLKASYGVSKINSSVFSLDKKDINKLEGYLKCGNEKKAIETIKSISDEIKACNEHNIDYIRNIFRQMLFAMASVAQARKDKAFINSTEHYLFCIMSQLSVNELERIILEALTCFFESDLKIEDEPITKLMDYINLHYSEFDLSIKQISCDLNFSDTYLCMLCKKNTGKTINNHITELRMKKACELLKSTDMKLYKIGEEIGYADGKYFFRVFQKMFSMTPREYRES